MKETSNQKQSQIRRVGIYLIVILSVLRFLIYPLHSANQEKKVLLNEQTESYWIKARLFEKQREGRAGKSAVEKKALFPHLFEKEVSPIYIQSDILKRVKGLAGIKGLAVLNFEMPEPVTGKNHTEVPILVRLKGRPAPFIEILESLEKEEKALSIRSMEITRSGEDQVYTLTLTAFRVER